MGKYIWRYKTKTIKAYDFEQLDNKVEMYLNGVSSHKFVSMSTNIDAKSCNYYCTIITKYKAPVDGYSYTIR